MIQMDTRNLSATFSSAITTMLIAFTVTPTACDFSKWILLQQTQLLSKFSQQCGRGAIFSFLSTTETVQDATLSTMPTDLMC
jgi:hypothetical protein